MTNTNNQAAYIWSLADLLRGDFKQSQYGRIILPFTLLRRLEAVLADSKPAVLVKYDEIKSQNLPEEAQEQILLRATGGLSFYNISKMDLSKLGESGLKDNLESYIQGFSADAREIFEQFKFFEFIGQLNDANLLYKVVQRVRQSDLSPQAVSNYEMGLIFEELIRRFAESSNETAGEHFTPRDIVRLTTSLVFMEDDEALTKAGIIRTIYDPTAGTGGFLSSGMEYVHELNPQAVMRAFGQELNPESYAICKADMLIKGQDVSNIKLGTPSPTISSTATSSITCFPILPSVWTGRKLSRPSRMKTPTRDSTDDLDRDSPCFRRFPPVSDAPDQQTTGQERWGSPYRHYPEWVAPLYRRSRIG